MKKFNEWLGDKLAFWLSTMECFYIICLAIIATLFFQRPVGVQAWLMFWVTVFFQGAALPVLGYVARVVGDKQEQVLRETHDTVMEELVILREELQIAKEEREMLKKLVETK